MNDALLKIQAVLKGQARYSVAVFFIAYFFLGLFIVKDYGVGFDEEYCRQRGLITYNYVVNHDQKLLRYDIKFMGQLFDTVLAAVEKNFSVFQDTRHVYFMRHSAIFLFFYLSVIFFYRLCLRKFGDWKVALLGCVFLVLSPRIFAHSFYNAKDIPFLSAVIISMFTMSHFLQKKTVPWALAHAFAGAIAIGIRALGGFLVIVTGVFYIAELILQRPPIDLKDRQKARNNFLIYIAATLSFSILFWPALWAGPIQQVKEASALANSFPVYGSFYLGRWWHPADQIPWHYIPVWMLITTPCAYSACFLAGCGLMARSFWEEPARFFGARRDDALCLMIVVLPVLIAANSVFVAKAALYSAWRHFYFIYPAFLIIALTGLVAGYAYIKIRFDGRQRLMILMLCVFFIMGSMAEALGFMVRNHPYEGLYFNALAGKNMQEVKKRFELDDWGLSYRKALEYILMTDPSPRITIAVFNLPGYITRFILPVDQRERLVYVKSLSQAKYYLNNSERLRDSDGNPSEYYSVKVDGTKIITVFKKDHGRFLLF